ncbi:MAG: hypothetical protein J6V25_02955 [Oscillospiraceae bacterium]|nr:hypothetical protein [Oscillospiraceae bacterium]
MKKFWQVISKKDLIFGLIILSLVVLNSFRPSNKVRFSFGEDSVDIRSTKFSMNVPYDMVDSLTLEEKPDMGIEVDGYYDRVIRTGTWKNETWGEYTSCVEVYTDNCIVIKLTDGRYFVVSRRDNEETQRVYEEFLTYLK